MQPVYKADTANVILGVILQNDSGFCTLHQHVLLDQAIRRTLRRDERVTHALAYGSFTQRLADRYSDLEYYLFLSQTEHAAFDTRKWLSRLIPIRHFVVNEGTPNALTDDLLRIELHIELNTQIADIYAWPAPAEHINPEAMLIKDTDGKLAAVLEQLKAKPRSRPEQEVQHILDRLLNVLAFGVNVLARGERIRALELVSSVQGGVLRLARVAEGSAGHLFSATRFAEQELSQKTVQRYADVTGGIAELERMYASAWVWTKELVETLQLSVPLTIDKRFVADLDARLLHSVTSSRLND